MMLLSLVTSASDFEKDGIEYTIKSVSDKTVYVSKITLGGNIVIPEKVLYNDYWFSVDSLGSLYSSNQTTSIKINNLIKTVGESLYASGTACYYVDEQNPYMKAIDGVLYSKDMTRLISFPMYKNCDEFTIPESVTSIDDYSFGANQYLKKLIFNDNIEVLPENFLYGSDYNGKLKYLKLSDKIKVIHGRCLYAFSSLEELVLPRDLEEVEKDKDWGYYGLPTKLTTVRISNSKIANYVYTLAPSIYVFSRFTQLKNLYVKDSNPVALDNSVFTEGQFFTINLYVPKGTKETYKNTEGWKNFFNIIEEGEQEQKEKCANPTIQYSNGTLSFNCETEGVEYVTNITDSDVKQHYGATILLSATYNINVYATKEGYDNSETVTATLCWIDAEPKTEGITNGVAEVRTRAILIKSYGGLLTVEGIDDGQMVDIYSLNGEKRGSAVGKNGVAQINTNLKAGNIAVIKIGNKSVKITIK